MLSHEVLALKQCFQRGLVAVNGPHPAFLHCSTSPRQRALSTTPTTRAGSVAQESSLTSAEATSKADESPVEQAETSSRQPQASSGKRFADLVQDLLGKPAVPPKRAQLRSAEEKERACQNREAKQRAMGFLPIPTMPSAPKYPCPYLTRDEISLYLVPLYRDGWVVGSSEFLKDKRLPRDEDSASPELTKAFLFAPEHRDARLEFAQSVGQLQTTEKHHCTVLVDDHSVRIRTHTHSARPLSSSQRGTEPLARLRPGITLRDVRLAYLVEKIFRGYLERGTALWRSQFMTKPLIRPLVPYDIERMRLMPTRTFKCPVCRGAHAVRDCPKKDSVKPRTPCKCGQMHWKAQCDAS